MQTWIAVKFTFSLMIVLSETKSARDKSLVHKQCLHEHRIVPGEKVPDCDEATLDAALAQFPSLEPQLLIKNARDKNLNEFCNDLKSSIHCLHDTLKYCYIPSHMQAYSCLIRGIEDIYLRICLNPSIEKTFLRHANCLHNLLSKSHNCNDAKEWSESSDYRVVCRGYKKLIDCYKLEACMACGPDAAEVLESIFIMSLKATLSIDCSYCFSMTDILGETLIRGSQSNSHVICYIFIFLLFAGLMFLRYGIL